MNGSMSAVVNHYNDEKRSAVVAIVKNEQDHIAEWVIYNLKIGFDSVIIYDNRSTDATKTILLKLVGRVDLQVVDWPSSASNYQITAYDDALARFGQSYRWMAFIDTDEYFVPTPGGSLPSILAANDDHDALAISWSIFGSSGHDAKPTGLLIESFTHRSEEDFGPNCHIKSIVNPAGTLRCINPHLFAIKGEYRDLEGQSFCWLHDVGLKKPNYSRGKLHHYFVRSRQHWADKLVRGYHDTERSFSLFETYDRNEIQDVSAVSLASSVNTVLDALHLGPILEVRGVASMTNIKDAVLWYKVLSSELGSNVNWGTPGAGGQKAQTRVKALIDLFFTISDELQLSDILEIGAHDAESSRRFIASDPHRKALAYDASPEVVQRVVAQGLPERFQLIQRAIGTKKGEITFYKPNDSFYAVWGSTARRAGFTDVTEIQVPIISLDEAAEPIQGSTSRNIALWVDVEGCALDVLTSGSSTLRVRVAVVYVELNDINAYEGSANAVKVIALFLELGFVPLARDNEYPDAWNLVFVHQSYFDKPREAFTRWTYAHLNQPDQH